MHLRDALVSTLAALIIAAGAAALLAAGLESVARGEAAGVVLVLGVRG